MTDRQLDLADRSTLVAPDRLTLQLVGALAALTGPDTREDALLAEHLGTSFALCVLRLLEDRPGEARAPTATLGTVQLTRVMRHIEENLGDGTLTIAELASVARVSPFHFARAFKAAVGCPPHRYVVERRIERAKALILGGRQPLAEIALLAGFADQAHFSTVFRRETGTSPSRFRAGR